MAVEIETEEQGTWTSISPTKRGRQMEKLGPNTKVNLASPSCFSILADAEETEEEETEKTDESEDGEIVPEP